MLSELNIENVAVIEKAAISLEKGFNVLTGETGAGKSILIDSINAILGNRTSKDIVRTGAERAVIWAVFYNVGTGTSARLSEQGYPEEDQLILHREITVDGKSICRINGKPASAQTVRDICSSLINIHGQHDNQDLMNPEKHIAILDIYASLQDMVQKASDNYDALLDLKRQIDGLSFEESEKERMIDLLSYQINEISAANLTPGEDDELSNRREVLKNSEKINHSLMGVLECLNSSDEETGALDRLYNAIGLLDSISGLSPEYRELAERFNDLYYGINDISSGISDLLDDLSDNGNDLETIEERLDLIYRLKKKYGSTIEEIHEFLDDSTNKYNSIQSADEQLELLKKKYKAKLAESLEFATELSSARQAVFDSFSGEIQNELSFLNMEQVSFIINRTETSLTRQGIDRIEFFVVTNVGEEPKPLAKVASGGELSRIMLAIKNALADKDDIDTLIFDEIDTGISGSSSDKIGQKLYQSSHNRQTICVTHSAQIAAYADCHLFVSKNVHDNRTFTEVNVLSDEERKAELARIISGDNVTAISLDNSGEMLRLAAQRKRDM